MGFQGLGLSYTRTMRLRLLGIWGSWSGCSGPPQKIRVLTMSVALEGIIPHGKGLIGQRCAIFFENADLVVAS